MYEGLENYIQGEEPSKSLEILHAKPQMEHCHKYDKK